MYRKKQDNVIDDDSEKAETHRNIKQVYIMKILEVSTRTKQMEKNCISTKLVSSTSLVCTLWLSQRHWLVSDFPFLALSCPGLPRPALPRLFLALSCLAYPCLAVPYLASLCLALPWPTLPCLTFPEHPGAVTQKQYGSQGRKTAPEVKAHLGPICSTATH